MILWHDAFPICSSLACDFGVLLCSRRRCICGSEPQPVQAHCLPLTLQPDYLSSILTLSTETSPSQLPNISWVPNEANIIFLDDCGMRDYNSICQNPWYQEFVPCCLRSSRQPSESDYAIEFLIGVCSPLGHIA